MTDIRALREWCRQQDKFRVEIDGRVFEMEKAEALTLVACGTGLIIGPSGERLDYNGRSVGAGERAGIPQGAAMEVTA